MPKIKPLEKDLITVKLIQGERGLLRVEGVCDGGDPVGRSVNSLNDLPYEFGRLLSNLVSSLQKDAA